MGYNKGTCDRCSCMSSILHYAGRDRFAELWCDRCLSRPKARYSIRWWAAIRIAAILGTLTYFNAWLDYEQVIVLMIVAFFAGRMSNERPTRWLSL
jgi:hypothetical protein